MKHVILAAVAAAALALSAAPAMAQADSHYSQGPLWYVTGVHVEDGQFENYMDWLAAQYKKINDFGIKEGVNLSYHILANTAKRANEPDLLLVVTSKDYLTIAQQEAYELKLNKLMAEDRRGAETAAAKRAPMRKIMDLTEYRELVLK